ncbi:N-alpha-acetyltransferase 60 [Cryptotermes secundus]|uniref:N-alpha-acetyltransferase 60 n=1 Tax=Cryptotermes secundus TaxID=105785 RepID=UPI000CD7D43D|nr:N-alpha-acetyltransferase 60 [Cryptotermes secundus]
MAGINWYAGCQINQKSCMTKPVPLCSLTNLQLRFLCPSDLEEVRALCQDWFPIDYPYSWYEDITSNPRFYSLAAVYDGVIIGLIVAEIKSYIKLNREDRGILSQSFSKQTEVGYILSLGVSKDHRRNGIASLLLDNLISHLTTVEHVDCKALFLHVLTTNSPAIHFYEHRNFRLHSFLPYYYSIKGKCKDGFTYVLYINGGHPPWGIYDYLKHYCGLVYRADPCSLPLWVWHKMQGAVHWVWPGIRRIVVQNTTAVFSFSS